MESAESEPINESKATAPAPSPEADQAFALTDSLNDQNNHNQISVNDKNNDKDSNQNEIVLEVNSNENNAKENSENEKDDKSETIITIALPQGQTENEGEPEELETNLEKGEAQEQEEVDEDKAEDNNKEDKEEENKEDKEDRENGEDSHSLDFDSNNNSNSNNNNISSNNNNFVYESGVLWLTSRQASSLNRKPFMKGFKWFPSQPNSASSNNFLDFTRPSHIVGAVGSSPSNKNLNGGIGGSALKAAVEKRRRKSTLKVDQEKENNQNNFTNKNHSSTTNNLNPPSTPSAKTNRRPSIVRTTPGPGSSVTINSSASSSTSTPSANNNNSEDPLARIAALELRLKLLKEARASAGTLGSATPNKLSNTPTTNSQNNNSSSLSPGSSGLGSSSNQSTLPSTPTSNALSTHNNNNNSINTNSNGTQFQAPNLPPSTQRLKNNNINNSGSGNNQRGAAGKSTAKRKKESLADDEDFEGSSKSNDPGDFEGSKDTKIPRNESTSTLNVVNQSPASKNFKSPSPHISKFSSPSPGRSPNHFGAPPSPSVGLTKQQRVVKGPEKLLNETIPLPPALKKARPLIEKLWKYPAAQKIFNSPVNYDRPHEPWFAPNYIETIKAQPMDLSTVKTKLNNGDYETLDDMAVDIRLIYRNATVYNPSTTFLHQVALECLDLFERELAKAKEPPKAKVKNSNQLDFSSDPLSISSAYPNSSTTGSNKEVDMLKARLANMEKKINRKSYDSHGRAVSLDSTPLTQKEKQLLQDDIFKLPPDKLAPVIEIIARSNTKALDKRANDDEEEFEIDIDKLAIPVLRELQDFVKKTLIGAKKKGQPSSTFATTTTRNVAPFTNNNNNNTTKSGDNPNSPPRLEEVNPIGPNAMEFDSDTDDSSDDENNQNNKIQPDENDSAIAASTVTVSGPLDPPNDKNPSFGDPNSAIFSNIAGTKENSSLSNNNNSNSSINEINKGQGSVEADIEVNMSAWSSLEDPNANDNNMDDDNHIQLNSQLNNQNDSSSWDSVSSLALAQVHEAHENSQIQINQIDQQIEQHHKILKERQRIENEKNETEKQQAHNLLIESEKAARLNMHQQNAAQSAAIEMEQQIMDEFS